MNPALFIRATTRRSLVNHSIRSFASRAPPPPPEDTPTSGQSNQAAGQQHEQAEHDIKPDTPVSSLPSLDFVPGEESTRERTGAKSSKDSLSSIERKRRFWGRVSLGALMLGAGVITWHSGRDWEEDELREMRMVCAKRSFYSV